jgi:hypothetical protein
MSADALTRFLRQPDIACKRTNEIRDLLKQPDRNHAPAHRAFLQKPLVDRWLLNGDDVQVMAGVIAANDPECTNTEVRIPADNFCILVAETGPENNVDLLFVKDRHRLFALLTVSANKRFEGTFMVVATMDTDGKTEPFDIFGSCWISDNPGFSGEFGNQLAGVLARSLVMIAEHRVASTRRVERRNDDDPTAREAIRRAQQRGVPWYSHNVVTLRRPGTSEFRGVILDSESAGAPKREHQVAGHWRLIELHKDENDDLCPYWTWVDGHLRGSAEAGRIEKTRIVEFSKPSEVARKGYLLPSGPGAPGARIKAVPAKVKEDAQ